MKPKLSAAQREVANLAFQRGCVFYDHKGNAWTVSKHALERMMERSGAQSFEDVKPHVAEISAAFKDACKAGVYNVKDSTRATYGKWDFRLDKLRRVIATIINHDKDK